MASILVVFYHLQNPLQRLGYDGPWLASLQGGVDLFFVLSGFLMLVTTAGKTGYILTFYQKRLVRIVPLYWIVTTVSVVLLMLVPGAVQSGRADAWHILSSYLFLPARHPVLGTIEPVVVPGWTLNDEMFFYLLWGLTLLLPERLRVPVAAGLLLALAGTGRLLADPGVAAAFYTSPILLEFVFGLGIGLWHLRGAALPAAWGWGLLAVGFLALLGQAGAPLGQRWLLWGGPAAMIVTGALVLERAGAVRKVPALVLLGDASYSVYIVHGMALSALGQAWRRLGLEALPGGLVLFALVAAAGAVAAGVAVHLLVERPLLRLMSGRDRPVIAQAP